MTKYLSIAFLLLAGCSVSKSTATASCASPIGTIISSQKFSASNGLVWLDLGEGTRYATGAANCFIVVEAR